MNKLLTVSLGLVGTLMLLFLGSCHNQIQLTGGPRDEAPPILDTTLSTPNNQVNFEKQKITLYFDEFVTVKDAIKQILVTPPLIYTPQVNERLERVTFEFDEKEVLKENATYVINFGESIVDYNESNKLENFTMVFSTGDYIDSLSIRGNVIDSKTQEASSEYLVMLYESVYDSVVYKEKPFYFARTNMEGQFEIKNLRADTFKIFVLNDKNVNYTYDYGEEIGFIDSLIYLTDSSSYDIALESFLEQTEARYLGYESIRQGQLRLEFNQAPSLDSLSVLSDNLDYTFSINAEKYIDVWYQPANLTKLDLVYRTDTIKTRINLRALDPLDETLDVTVSHPTEQIGLHPTDQIVLETNYPIDSVSAELISLRDTLSGDLLIFDAQPVEGEPMQLALQADYKLDQNLELSMLPGAIKDLWGHSNDTTENFVLIGNPEDFGIIELQFSKLDSSVANYHITLLDSKESIVQTNNVSIDTTITVSELYPGSYTLQIIEDRDDNELWSAGNYLKKVQSEKFFEVPLEDVRGNWTVEKEIILSGLEPDHNNLYESTESDEPE